MASRQDQLHSYQFMVQRVVAALVMRETDPAQSPFRRVAGATLVGVILAALAVGGAAVIAVLSPGASGKWRNDKAVILEEDSGALFVYRDEVLHPVLNQASALLILNAAGAQTVAVSRAALAEAPRGVPLGIPGAPTSLPSAAALSKDPWTACSTKDGSVLFVGKGPTGGTALGERGLLVTTAGAKPDVYLLWHAAKHLIRQPGAALPALVWSARPQVTVAQAFLHAVPSGTDLVMPAVPGHGTSVAGGKVGQLFDVRGADRVDSFVMTADGLASLTPLQAALLLASPDSAGLPAKRNLTPGEFSALVQGKQVKPFAPDQGGDAALPNAVPELLDSKSTVVCTGSQIAVGNTVPDLAHALKTTAGSEAGTVLADRILVTPGGGALVRTDTGVLNLITDLGRRHALPVPDVVAALGYQNVEPVKVPAELVGLLPAGPALDPAAAVQPQ